MNMPCLVWALRKHLYFLLVLIGGYIMAERPFSVSVIHNVCKLTSYV